MSYLWVIAIVVIKALAYTEKVKNPTATGRTFDRGSQPRRGNAAGHEANDCRSLAREEVSRPKVA